MDLLSQYKQQNPHIPPEPQKTDQQSGQEEGFFARLVINLSGGRIRSTQQAGFILLVGVVILVIAAIIIAWPRGGQRTPTSAEMKEILRKMGNFPSGSSPGSFQ